MWGENVLLFKLQSDKTFILRQHENIFLLRFLEGWEGMPSFLCVGCECVREIGTEIIYADYKTKNPLCVGILNYLSQKSIESLLLEYY